MSEPIDFAKALAHAAEKSLLQIITDGKWVEPNYASRFKVPPEFVAGIWAMVDQNKVQQALAARIEVELADRIINHMAAEIATDIKQVLSVKERREALRNIAREHIEFIMAAGGPKFEPKP